MSWELVKLGELITESRIPSENPDPDRRITVRLNVLGVEKRPLENEKAGATKQFIRKAGQFIYGKQNFHKGAFGIIPEELDGFESSADLPSFDVREDCLSEWIFYFFKQGGYYLELAKIARGVATQRIHAEQIYDLEIPLPDVETQKKIIASIKAIEVKGEKLKNELAYQLTQLENLNQAILQEAVQGKLVLQDPRDEPASELLKRIKAEKAKSGKKEKPLPPIKPEEIPFDIPENWVWCRLGEIIFDTEGGKSPHCLNQNVKGDEWGVIKTTAVQQMEFLEDENKILPKGFKVSDNHKVCIDDVLITRAGPQNRVGVVCSVNQLSKNLILSDKTIRFRHPKNLIYSKYLATVYNAPKMKTIISSKMVGMAESQVNISQDNMKTFLFPLPPLSEQKRIVAEIEKQFAKTKQLKEHIIANQQATEQLLKALLHQAFEVREKEEV
jgi:type I restriction enzyme, S subunit